MGWSTLTTSFSRSHLFLQMKEIGPWEWGCIWDCTSCCYSSILDKTKVQANTLLHTLLRCDLFSLGLCLLVSPLEVLLPLKLWGGNGGLEAFTGLNVILCLLNVLIPGDAFRTTLCRDLVSSRPADDSRPSWAIECSVCIEMPAWSSKGGCTVAIWSGVRMFSFDLKKKKTLASHLQSFNMLSFCWT